MKLEITRSWIQKCLAEKGLSSSPPVLNESDLEDFTQEMLCDLKAVFEHFIEAFNDLKSSFLNGKENPSPENISSSPFLNSIHIYDVAGKKNGFMLFRKGCRLIFTPSGPGRIHIQMIQKTPSQETKRYTDSYLNAVSNNAMSLHWIHEEHEGFVDINTLARYYMKFFLKESEKWS